MFWWTSYTWVLHGIHVGFPQNRIFSRMLEYCLNDGENPSGNKYSKIYICFGGRVIRGFYMGSMWVFHRNKYFSRVLNNTENCLNDGENVFGDKYLKIYMWFGGLVIHGFYMGSMWASHKNKYFSRVLKLYRKLSERWRKSFWRQIFKDLYVVWWTSYTWVLHGIHVGFPQK